MGVCQDKDEPEASYPPQCRGGAPPGGAPRGRGQHAQQWQQQRQPRPPPGYAVGEAVEGWYEGDYYPAVITGVSRAGYDIQWYDSSISQGVTPDFLRRPPNAAPAARPGPPPQPTRQQPQQQQQDPASPHAAAALQLWRGLGARSDADLIDPERVARRLRDPGLLAAFRWPPSREVELVDLLTRRDRLSAGACPAPPGCTLADLNYFCRARSLFEAVDRNRQGRVNSWELENVIGGSDEQAAGLRAALGVPAKVAPALLRQMDTARRGFVELPEWARYWFLNAFGQVMSLASGEAGEKVLIRRLFPQGRTAMRLSDLQTAMEQDTELQLRLGWPAYEAEQLFQFLDRDQDGLVSAEELTRFVHVQCVFNQIDEHYTGFIDPFELGRALENPRLAADLGCTAANAQALWQKLDTDGTGAVTFAEFHDYFAPRLTKLQLGGSSPQQRPVAPPQQRPQRQQHPRDKYKKLRKLGEGTFGRVYLIERRSDGLKLILKEPKPQAGVSMADVEQEARMLARLKHPHIVRFVDQYWEKDALLIITEFADGGDLRARIVPGGVPAEQALQWFEQTCQAIEYLHARRIIHRDLKPDNIFLTSGGSVKVGDLGMAKDIGGQWGSWHQAKTECGTQVYMAPEIFRGEPYADRADVWALGCILHELATGAFAFRTVAAVVHHNIPKNTPQYCAHIVRALLTEDPAARPDMTQVMSLIGMADEPQGMASYVSFRRLPGRARTRARLR